jgi:hypothetical protein
MKTNDSRTTRSRRFGLAATLGVLGVALALTLGAATSFAALHTIGSPSITGSWTQTFNESGVGTFDRVQILAVTGGPFEVPITQSAFNVGGWAQDCSNAIESSASGTANANMNWDITFQGPPANPLSFYFQAYNGATLLETAYASWNGAGFTIDNLVPGTGTWLGGPTCAYLNSVSGIEPFTCITLPTQCVTIPIDIIRNDATQMRAYSVSFTLSPELALCTTPAASVTQGTYLSSLPLSSTDYHVVSNGGGSYTVDCALLGLPCGQGDPAGNLFNVSVKGVAAGVGTLTITSVITRDCSNADIACTFGPPVPVTVDFTAPLAIGDLAASQLPSGNGVGPTRGIQLTWSGAAGTVSLYRAPEGAYPEYSDDGAISPPSPAAAPGPPWSLVNANAASGYVDAAAPRGFWRYVAFVTDACGNTSLVSNMTTGLLNYLLGDVTPAPGAGDNVVDGLDISLLGFNYGLVGEVPVDAVDYLDVGPTLTGSPSARPKPDDIIGFEDLVIFAINYGANVQAPQFAAAPAAMERDELTVEAPSQVSAGQMFTVSLRLKGAGDIQALSSQLGYDRTKVEALSVKAGELLGGQNGVVFSSGPGNVDAALLGVRGQGLSGEGVLATVSFRAIGNGDPKIGLARLVARDAGNHPVQLAGGGAIDAAMPIGLWPAAPNPFQHDATLGFSIAKAGPVNLSILSVDGRRVKTLFAGTREVGVYRVSWNGTDENGNQVRPGVFYARLVTAAGQYNRTITFIK